MRRAAVLAAVGLGVAGRIAAQPSGEAWLTVARGYHASPVGDGAVAGLTAGFGIGSPTLVFGPELVLRSSDSLRVRGFALGARLRQRSQTFQPHLVVTVGAYAWQRAVAVAEPGGASRRWAEVDYVSASLGAGLTIGRWRGRWSGLVEARWHRNVATDPAEGSRSLVGVDAGLRLAW